MAAKDFFDVAVVGAGPGGSITAKLLAESGCRVLLLDQPKPSAHKLGETLSGSAKPLLQHLGLLQWLDKDPSHIPALGYVSSWGSNDLDSRDNLTNPFGNGWMLNRLHFDRGLQQLAKNFGVHFLRERLRKFKFDSQLGWELEVGSKLFRAKRVVDASGRGAIVAQRFGAKKKEYRSLAAVYQWLNCKVHDRDQRVYIEAADNGWWYTARIPNQQRILVFHTQAGTARKLTTSPILWKKTLQASKNLREVIKGSTFQNKIRMHACGSNRLQQFSFPGGVAVGDAAMAFDPLSAQGIFNALYTGMKAADALTKEAKGESRPFADYDRELSVIFAKHLQHLDFFYSLEQRFPNSGFWRDRQNPPVGAKSG